MNILIKIRRQIFLLKNKLLFNFSTHVRGDKKHIVIPAIFTKITKYLKHIISVISLISAYFIFKTPHYAFLFAIGVWLLLSLLERVLFSHITFFKNPLPNFNLCAEKWVAMGFGYPPLHMISQGLKPTVVMMFDDKIYARKIHDLILSWTEGSHKDTSSLVSLSVTILSDSYIFYIYPSLSRAERLGSYDNLREKFHDDFPQSVHKRKIASVSLGRKFNMPKSSSVIEFRKHYKKGEVVTLQIAFQKNIESNFESIEGCQDFRIVEFKIKDRNDLTRKDPEYDLIRYVEI